MLGLTKLMFRNFIHSEWSEKEVLDKLLPTIELKRPLIGFILLFEEQPIGYLQYYKIKDFPWPQQDFEPKIVNEAAGIDLFIGNRNYIGKGLGQKIVDHFLKSLIWPRFQFCIVDPDQRNLSSIKMFEKSGFIKHKIINSTDATGKPVNLMLMIKQLIPNPRL